MKDISVQEFEGNRAAFVFEHPLQGGTGVNDDALERQDGSAREVASSSVPQLPNQQLDGLVVVVGYRRTDGVEPSPRCFPVDPHGHSQRPARFFLG